MKIFMMSSVHRWDDTRVFYREAVSLAKKYDIELHAPADFADKKINGVHIVGLPKWKKETDRIKLWGILFKRILASDAEVLHFHDPELLPLAFFLKFLKGKKIIYDVHEHYLNDIMDKEWIPKSLRFFVKSIFSVLERICVPFFNAVIYTTPIVGERYLSMSNHAYSIENYPLRSLFYKGFIKKEDTSSEDIIYLGRVFYVRGVEEMIRCWPHVLKKYPHARFLIVGDIVPESYEKHLKKITRDLGLEDRVIFCGFVPFESTGEYLDNALAGIVTFLPYKNNMSCLPNKLFEYMASGIPVIASDFPLYKEVVKPSKCGLLVDPTKIDQLVNACLSVLENKATAIEMGENGRKAFEDRYNWENEEDKLFTIYDQL